MKHVLKDYIIRKAKPSMKAKLYLSDATCKRIYNNVYKHFRYETINNTTYCEPSNFMNQKPLNEIGQKLEFKNFCNPLQLLKAFQIVHEEIIARGTFPNIKNVVIENCAVNYLSCRSIRSFFSSNLKFIECSLESGCSIGDMLAISTSFLSIEILKPKFPIPNNLHDFFTEAVQYPYSIIIDKLNVEVENLIQKLATFYEGSEKNPCIKLGIKEDNKAVHKEFVWAVHEQCSLMHFPTRTIEFY